MDFLEAPSQKSVMAQTRAQTKNKDTAKKKKIKKTNSTTEEKTAKTT